MYQNNVVMWGYFVIVFLGCVSYVATIRHLCHSVTQRKRTATAYPTTAKMADLYTIGSFPLFLLTAIFAPRHLGYLLALLVIAVIAWSSTSLVIATGSILWQSPSRTNGVQDGENHRDGS